MSAILMEIGSWILLLQTLLSIGIPGLDSPAGPRRMLPRCGTWHSCFVPLCWMSSASFPRSVGKVARVARRTGLRVKMIADELNDDLTDANRTCIFRVVQEALNNCAKHARANEVRVVVHRDSDGLSISVQDDGAGFDPARNKGLGLMGMMERVNGLGGRFHIESKPGSGAILSTWFPLEANRCNVEEPVI